MKTKTKEPLTPRQLEVAQWIVNGLPDKQIAQRMNISTSTVTNTKRNIYAKYGFNNNTELAAFYFAAYHRVSTDFDVVGKIKRAINAIAMLTIVSIHILACDDMQRVRRCGRGRRNEYEITCNNYL